MENRSPRRDPVGRKILDLALEDFSAEEGALDLEPVLFDIDVPAPPSAAPAIAAGFQHVLGRDG